MTDAPTSLTAPMASFPDGAVVRLALGRIVGSLTNPRKTFNAEKLAELAVSIKASDVHSPILVRPLPSSRLQDTYALRQPGEDLPEFEIVYGERRFRASKLADALTVPAVVRNLTDDQVLDIQITENLQRDDLLPLEEAEGYQLLMKHSNLSADQVAVKIGKSKAYVYARIKLLGLCSVARDALRAGALDASKALLVARIPNDALQLKALKQVTDTDYYGQQISYRRAADLVQREYMLRLDAARFKITDAGLHPEAGSCRECVKRTGHSPDLFSDVSHADVCTDPVCFHEKEARHDDVAVKAAAERGMKIIQGKEAKEAWPNSYNELLTGYQRLDKPDLRLNSGKKTLKKLLGDDCPTPILLQSPHNGEIVEVLPKDQVNKLLKRKGLVSNEMARLDATKPDHEIKAKIEEKYQRAWRRRSIEKVFDAIQNGVGGLSYDFMRVVAGYMLSGLVNDDRQQIAALLGLGKIDSEHEIRQYLEKCEDIEAEHALQLLTMQHQAHWNGYSTVKGAPTIELLAKEFCVDVGAIQKSVREEQAPKPAAPKASVPQPPAAQAGGVRGEKKAKGKKASAAPDGELPKTSPEFASAQIAEAMQALDGALPGSADAPQSDDAVPVLRQAQETMPAAADDAQDTDSGAAEAAQGDEVQAVLRQPAADAAPFVIGQAVRFKEGIRGPDRHVRKVAGREGVIEAAAGVDWMVRCGFKATDLARARVDEIEAVGPAPTEADGLIVNQRVMVNPNVATHMQPWAGQLGRIVSQSEHGVAWEVRLDPSNKKKAQVRTFAPGELVVVTAR